MQEIGDLINRLFGEYSSTLNIGQIALRAVFIYLVTLALVQLGHNKRFTGEFAAFDVILGIILGSVLSRTVNGSAPLGGTLVAGLLLIFFHWSFARLAYHSHALGRLVKGSSRQLVEDGKMIENTMRQESISRRDLEEAIRREGMKDIENVKEAYSERNGAISILTESPQETEIVNYTVEVVEGVQKVEITVRIA